MEDIFGDLVRHLALIENETDPNRLMVNHERVIRKVNVLAINRFEDLITEKQGLLTDDLATELHELRVRAQGGM
jgi:hypothetical protein